MKKEEFVVENGTLVAYHGKGGDVIIPDGVTAIGEEAFYDCAGLTSIVIPEGVTKIGDNAFTECRNLTAVVFPASVTEIGLIFPYCVNLSSITVKDGNPVYHSAGNCLIETATKTLKFGSVNSVIPADGSVTVLANYSLLHCYELEKIRIPAYVTTIEQYAFISDFPASKSALEFSLDYLLDLSRNASEITVEDGNPVYHSAGNCLIETATKTLILACGNSVIPADGSVTKIAPGAFTGCASLTRLVIPNCVTEIGHDAFEECSNLTDITLPRGVTHISAGMFANCIGLTDYTIPDHITNIGECAFINCGLERVTIPDSVKKIDDRAFEGCGHLTIYAPNGSYAAEYAKKNGIPVSFI